MDGTRFYEFKYIIYIVTPEQNLAVPHILKLLEIDPSGLTIPAIGGNMTTPAKYMEPTLM